MSIAYLVVQKGVSIRLISASSTSRGTPSNVPVRGIGFNPPDLGVEYIHLLGNDPQGFKGFNPPDLGVEYIRSIRRASARTRVSIRLISASSTSKNAIEAKKGDMSFNPPDLGVEYISINLGGMDKNACFNPPDLGVEYIPALTSPRQASVSRANPAEERNSSPIPGHFLRNNGKSQRFQLSAHCKSNTSRIFPGCLQITR